MFSVGDKVVYPMHGAGIIEAIKEEEVLGEKRRYYIMYLPLGEMKVMVPTANIQQLGLRQVVDEEGVQQIFRILRGNQGRMSTNWNQRYRANMEKIRSGDVFAVAEVVKNLSWRKKERGLSSGESKMLDSARQILVSELVLARDMQEEVAEGMIDELCG